MQGAAGDASDTWQNAAPLSAAALGPGCITESIAPGNTCGAAADNVDWFRVDNPVPPTTSPPTTVLLSTITVTLSFAFGFCGSANINSDIVVYFVPLGRVLPQSTFTSADGHGPGTKVCESHNAGAATEVATCTFPPGVTALGRWYVEKTRIAGSGANTLRVSFA